MRYVEVPVPEELVEDVQQFLSWKAELARPAPNVSLERADVEDLVAGLDDAGRALLQRLAFPTPEMDPTFLGFAAALGLTPREVVGAITELNVRLVDACGLGAMIAITPMNGTVPLHHRVLTLPELVAGPLREVLPPTDETGGQSASGICPSG